MFIDVLLAFPHKKNFRAMPTFRHGQGRVSNYYLALPKSWSFEDSHSDSAKSTPS
jgi:hypothetical protein